MNKKSYVIMGAFFVGVLSLSLFANFNKIQQEANSLDAQSENPGLQAIGTEPMVDPENPQVDNNAEQATEVMPQPEEWQGETQKTGLLSGLLDLITGGDKHYDPKKDDAAEPSDNTTTKVAGGGSSAPTSVSALGDRVFFTGGFIVNAPTSGDSVTASTAAGGPITWSKLLPPPAPLWISRSEHASVSFLNQIWILGGVRLGAATSANNGIWASFDGINWGSAPKVAPPNIPWELKNGIAATRIEHAAVVYNNEIWLTGGTLREQNGTQTKMDDVWKSPDGVTWNPVLTGAPFGKRSNHEMVVFNGILWLLGDSDFTASPSLWSYSPSNPGVTHWVLSQSGAQFNANFGQRRDFGYTVHNGAVYVLGGMRTIQTSPGNFVSTRMNDVWVANNGINFSPVVPGPGPRWSAREKLKAFSFDGKLWVGPGQDSNSSNTNDLWSSSDNGVTWHQEVAQFPANGFADYGVAILPPPSQVDLQVTDLAWAEAPVPGKYSHNPINGSASQPAYLEATITNNSASSFTVPAGVEYKLFLKDMNFQEVVGSFTMTPGQVIPAGGSVAYDFPESLYTGGPVPYYYIRSANFNSTVVVISHIDVTNTVAESDETNNTLLSEIPVNRYLLCDTSTSAPNVYIHFPNGGQQFYRGTGFNAGYDACNINGSNLIEIGIVGYGALAVGPNTGWQHVVIPTSMAPGSYKFYVRDINSGAIDDSNNPIIIY